MNAPFVASPWTGRFTDNTPSHMLSKTGQCLVANLNMANLEKKRTEGCKHRANYAHF